MPVDEEMTRDDLIALLVRKDALVERQAQTIERQDAQIARQAAEISELVERAETLEARLAKLEYLLSRNSRNSSSSSSHDDDLGKTPPPKDPPGGRGERGRGKQKGAPGTHLAWSDVPDETRPRFPEGVCGCGNERPRLCPRHHRRRHPHPLRDLVDHPPLARARPGRETPWTVDHLPRAFRM